MYSVTFLKLFLPFNSSSNLILFFYEGQLYSSISEIAPYGICLSFHYSFFEHCLLIVQWVQVALMEVGLYRIDTKLPPKRNT